MVDPDLQIRWEGGSHPEPEIRGGGGSLQKCFGSKNKGGPPGPSPRSSTGQGSNPSKPESLNFSGFLFATAFAFNCNYIACHYDGFDSFPLIPGV